jgi:hypothetical protein
VTSELDQAAAKRVEGVSAPRPDPGSWSSPALNELAEAVALMQERADWYDRLRRLLLRTWAA